MLLAHQTTYIFLVYFVQVDASRTSINTVAVGFIAICSGLGDCSQRAWWRTMSKAK